MLGDISSAGANAARNIANFVRVRCGLTHAGANLQRVGNVGDGAGPLYASTIGLGSSGRFANAGVATTQSRRMPKEDADQINYEGRQTDPWTNKRSKVAKWVVSEAASARLVGTKPKRSCKSNDVLDGDRRDVDERTRRDLDEFDNELYKHHSFFFWFGLIDSLYLYSWSIKVKLTFLI